MYAVCRWHLKYQIQKTAYLLIMNMNHSSTKNAEIKIRIRKEDKTRLQESAKKQNMTLSDYILTKCSTDTDNYIQMIPDAVETWNIYNKILRAVKNTHNKQLMTDVENMISQTLQKTRFSEGGTDHGQDR